MNMRRILKKPCLRMEDGGSAPAVYTQDMQNHDRMAAAGARTQTYQPMMAMPGSLQLREGGGPVPGSGKGDKIPALYEPGEFVVSNDMLKAAPGLREELHGLRADVLAKKGMTPAQADAKAVAYDGGSQGEQHGQGTQELQANGRPEKGPKSLDEQRPGGVPVSGVRGVSDTVGIRAPQASLRLAKGGGPGATDWMARNLQGQNMVPPASPMQSTADALKGGTPNVAEPAAAPKAPLNSPEAQAWRASRVSGTTPAAPAAPSAPGASPYSLGKKVGGVFNNPVLRGAVRGAETFNAIDRGLDAVTEAQNGNYAGALDHGLRAAAHAGAANYNPVAMSYLAGAQVGDNIYSKMDDTQRMGVGDVVNNGLRNLGGVFGQKWGNDTSAMDTLQGMDLSSPVPITGGGKAAAPARPGLPATGAGAGRGRGGGYSALRSDQTPGATDPTRDFSKELNGAKGPLPADLRQGVIHKTTDAQGRVTYSGRNVGQRADGSTQMVDGTGRDLQMRGHMDVVAPGSIGLTQNGFAGTPVASDPAQRQAQLAAGQAAVQKTLRNPDGSQWSAQDNAIMSANLRDGVDPYRGTSRTPAGGDDANAPKRGEFGYKNYMANKIAMEQNANVRRGQDMELEGRMAPLRIQQNMRQLAAEIQAKSGGNHAASAELAMRYGSPELAKQFQELHSAQLANETAQQAQGQHAEANTRNALKVYAPGKDGVTVEDPGASAAMYDTAAQVIPGFTQMDERSRNQALAQSKDLMDLFLKLRGQKQMGADAVNPFEQKKPALTGLPNLTGGKTSQASGIRGALTPGISGGDYFVTHRDGREVPLGNLNSRQLDMMDMAHRGMSWQDILKATQGAK